MKVALRKRINRKIYEQTNSLSNEIQLTTIDKILREDGFLLVNEDGTPWSGLLLGESSQCNIEVGSLSKVENEMHKIEENMVVLSWYRHTTGRIETTAYLS